MFIKPSIVHFKNISVGNYRSIKRFSTSQSLIDNIKINQTFSKLSTPLVADACLRLKVPVRVAPPNIRSLLDGSHVAGRVLPSKHYGSVDIFLEAMRNSQKGDILVIDNGGRDNEACIGDLAALEAKANGLTGIVIWGRHRDTKDLKDIQLPVFSTGSCPMGPERLDKRDLNAFDSATIGSFSVGRQDVVFADADGVLFCSAADVERVLTAATQIYDTERKQAAKVKAGNTLYEQLRFGEYLTKRASNPSLTFRQHLQAIKGSIEE
mmetsp:Transcript_11844/g.16428  ORF Transcript_11844/g.16428 Transcript_11844/m.16428 type:complete len:266 (-) Transcript_11844:93-890(-)